MNSLADIFLAAANAGEQSKMRKLEAARQARADEFENQRMVWLREDRDREQAREDEARAAEYEAQNQAQYAGQARRGFVAPQIDPTVAAQVRGEQAVAADQVAAQERSRLTAAVKINYERAISANPKAAGPLQQQLAHLVKTGQIDAFDVAQPQVAKTQEHWDEAAKRVFNKYGHAYGSPPFQKAYQAELALMRREAAAGRAPQGPTTAEVETSLRKEFSGLPVVKDTQTLAAALQKVNTASDTGPGDMGLIFGYMKMLDPNSTVREGEYATAENAGSIPGRIVNLYNKAIEGDRLAPDLRTQFKTEARKIFGAQKSRYDEAAKQYKRLAQEGRGAPGNVVLDAGYDALVADPGTGGPAANVPPEFLQRLQQEAANGDPEAQRILATMKGGAQ
jgi:hypothetical protein